MPLLNFKKQFASKVESGDKRQTIRAYRKDGLHPKAGDTLYLYTGLRTKAARKLKETKCKTVEPIIIEWLGSIKISGISLSPLESHAFAVSDGFTSIQPFIDFFRETHAFPFKGLLIKW